MWRELLLEKEKSVKNKHIRNIFCDLSRLAATSPECCQLAFLNARKPKTWHFQKALGIRNFGFFLLLGILILCREPKNFSFSKSNPIK